MRTVGIHCIPCKRMLTEKRFYCYSTGCGMIHPASPALLHA